MVLLIQLLHPMQWHDIKDLRGYDVRFLTGMDEHGQKIQEKAQEAGKDPQDYVNEIAEAAKKVMGINGYFL